jgi:hypothetical protein
MKFIAKTPASNVINALSDYAALAGRVNHEVAEEMYEVLYQALPDYPKVSIYLEVGNERQRQDKKWGGPVADDNRKTPHDWCSDIAAYVAWAHQMSRCGSPEKYRHRLMQIAALAVAACESYDRLQLPEFKRYNNI